MDQDELNIQMTQTFGGGGETGYIWHGSHYTTITRTEAKSNFSCSQLNENYSRCCLVSMLSLPCVPNATQNWYTCRSNGLVRYNGWDQNGQTTVIKIGWKKKWKFLNQLEDSRWIIQENQIEMEGSISILLKMGGRGRSSSCMFNPFPIASKYLKFRKLFILI